MAILVAVGAFAALVLIISFFGYRYYARPGRVYKQLGGPAVVMQPIDGSEPGDRVLVTVVEQIGEMVPVSPEDASVIRRDLIAAGFRGENAVAIYLGLRL